MFENKVEAIQNLAIFQLCSSYHYLARMSFNFFLALVKLQEHFPVEKLVIQNCYLDFQGDGIFK